MIAFVMRLLNAWAARVASALIRIGIVFPSVRTRCALESSPAFVIWSWIS